MFPSQVFDEVKGLNQSRRHEEKYSSDLLIKIIYIKLKSLFFVTF